MGKDELRKDEFGKMSAGKMRGLPRRTFTKYSQQHLKARIIEYSLNQENLRIFTLR